MSYDVGDIVHLSCTFTDIDGVPTNPTTVTLSVTNPVLAATTYTPTNPSTGVYEYDYQPSVVGKHLAKFKGTGALIAAEYVPFYVRDAQAELFSDAYPMGHQSWKATP